MIKWFGLYVKPVIPQPPRDPGPSGLYISLPTGSVRTWDEMKELFTSRFFNTTREVQLSKLSTLTQHRDELELKVNLCRNGIKNEIAILMNEQIITFQAFTTKACLKECNLAQQKIWKKEISVDFKKKKLEDTFSHITEVKASSPQTPKGAPSRKI
ncbi:hypothetical protein ACLOJK_004191 [Asimina triloba]